VLLNLQELQVPSAFVPSLAGLRLRKLTVIHRPYSNLQPHHFTVEKLPELTHLNIVADHILDASQPVLDFRSLPKLRHLAISQRRLLDTKHVTAWGTPDVPPSAKAAKAPAFMFLGTPEGLQVLSLAWTSMPARFQQACQQLKHLHLVDIATSEPLIFPELVTLELVDCVVPTQTWERFQLPALKHILDITDTRYLQSRATNPLACLGHHLDNLETIIAIYPEVRNSAIQPWNPMFETLDHLKRTKKLKCAMTMSNHMDTDKKEKWGWRWASRGRFCLVPWRIEEIEKCDETQRFIQTRMARFLRGLKSSDLSQSHQPLENQYYHAYAGCAWRWRRNVLASPRISFMDDIKLLNGNVVYKKLVGKGHRIYPVVEDGSD
jgi:hypothetical protein